MDARPFIDSLDFARNGKRLSGNIPLAELPRLQDSLYSAEGILEYIITGGVDMHGDPLLDLNLSANCRLVCQRCLGGMDHQLRINTRLMLKDQASLDALGNDEILAEDEQETFDSILAESHLDLLELLEEEIILSLPIAPKHPQGICNTEIGLNEQKENPFAVLMKLKRN